MTTPDPITIAREALNRACRVPQQYPSRDDLFAIQTVIDHAEKLKAERDEAQAWAKDQHASADRYAAEITRLTSQLEQAEKVMEYAGDVRWLELAQGSPFTTIDRQMLHEMHSRASQWIKDRQAKTDHIAEVGKMVDPDFNR